VAYFKDSQELEEILGGFMEAMRADPELGPQVRTAGIQTTFNLNDPALTVTIDAVNPATQGGPFNIYYGPPPLDAPIQLALSADNAHRLWQGALNPMTALAQGDIQVTGPLMQLLTLLPVVQPAFARYRAYLTEIGRPDLIV